MKSGLRIVLCCLGVLLFAAASCEDQVNENSKDEILNFENGIRAIVTTKFVDEGCEALLEIQENGEKIMLLPIEFDEMYKIHGLQLLITFHSSRIMQSTCQIGRPIVIEKIQLIG